MAKKKRDGFYKRKGSRFWYTRDPRTDAVRSTGFETLDAARAAKATWELEAADPRAAAVDAETVETCCTRLIESRVARGKSTLFHEQKLAHWVNLFGPSRKLATIGPAEFDAYLRHRRDARPRGKPVKDHTIGKEVGVMLRAMRLSKRLGLYAGELSVLRPFDLSSGYVPRTRALDAAELAALLAELPDARGAFVALCVGLGLRRSEAFALRPEHVDLELGVVFVPGTKTAGARRVLPILPPFRGLIARASAHLPLAAWCLGQDARDIGRACRRAGIPKCTANDLRRTHATLLRSAGVDRDVARRLLGHAPKSTMLETIYDQPKPLELAARAGELASLTRQLAGVELLTGGNRNASGNAQRHSRRVREPLQRVFAGKCGADVRCGARFGVAEASPSLHTPAAHALAMAFVNVTRRGAA